MRAKHIFIIFFFLLYMLRWIFLGVWFLKIRTSIWYTYMAATSLSRGEMDEGEKMLKEALNQKYVYPEAYLKYGLFLLTTKNNRFEALPYLLKARMTIPWKDTIYRVLSENYASLNLWNEAIYYAHLYASINPAFENRLWLAFMLCKAGRIPDAFFLIKDLKQEAPSNPFVLLLYSVALLYYKQEGDALFWLEKAFSLTPHEKRRELKEVLETLSHSLSESMEAEIRKFLSQIK